MSDCCKKIIIQNEIITPEVVGTHTFTSVVDTMLDIPYLMEHYMSLDGDYIIHLNLFLVGDSYNNGTIKSTVTKNGSTLMGNDNAIHKSSTQPVNSLTHTHHAKVTGLTAGDTLGFLIESDLTIGGSEIMYINNGSITAFKVA